MRISRETFRLLRDLGDDWVRGVEAVVWDIEDCASRNCERRPRFDFRFTEDRDVFFVIEYNGS